MLTRPDSAIGAQYDPFGAHLDDPYSFYARARREQPVFYAPAFRAWVVTRYADVRQVLMNPGAFSSANAARPMTATLTPECLAELKQGYPLTAYFLNTDGAAHQRLRAPLTKVLGTKGVRRFEPFIREQAGALVDAMLPAGNAEFMRQFAHPLPFRVTARLLGIDEADHQVMLDGSFASSRLFRKGGLPPSEQLAYARGLVRYQRLLMKYIVARRAEPRDDLISAFVAELAPGSAPLTFEQECRLVWSLMGVGGAGNWTTASMLGMGMYYLLADRERWNTLVARPDLIGRAVEEICRYDPPSQAFPRITTRPVTIGEVDLPAGTEIIVLPGSANRDEALADRPEEFAITRPQTRHLTFGRGPHVCAGARLARTQARIALETLTRRLPGLRIADGRPVPIAAALNHRQPRELHITW
jgi:cytochrome P450